jgi:hypothetical protein
MANGTRLFARALPSEIRVEETYPYTALVRSLPQISSTADQPPRGVIEARVPYDGQRFFTGRALDDVRELVRLRSVLADEALEPLEAHIGHLVVTHYGRSRLAESDGVARHGAVPLVVPVSGNSVRGMDDLSRGQLEGRAQVTYEPQPPSPVPVHIEVTISDEDGLAALQAALQRAETAGELKDVERLRHQLAEELGRKGEFEPSLRFAFDVQLELPAPIGVADDPAPPLLSQLWLAWPVLASYRRVLLLVEDRHGQMQPYPIAYDPVRGRLAWGGLRFFPPPGAVANGLYVYQAPRMELYVREPGELLEVTVLDGQLAVEFESLMSGLELRYFDAAGAPQPAPVATRSVLETALTVDVADCFERRRFSPYQYVQFPGMVLNRMRLGDIVALLESMQFTVVGEPEEIVDEDATPFGVASRVFLVTATRAEGASHLWLWLRIGGQAVQGERRGSGEGEGPAPIRATGDLTVAMRAELDGSSHEPVEVLNELHKRLKRRFHFERVVR